MGHALHLYKSCSLSAPSESDHRCSQLNMCSDFDEAYFTRRSSWYSLSNPQTHWCLAVTWLWSQLSHLNICILLAFWSIVCQDVVNIQEERLVLTAVSAFSYSQRLKAVAIFLMLNWTWPTSWKSMLLKNTLKHWMFTVMFTYDCLISIKSHC